PHQQAKPSSGSSNDVEVRSHSPPERTQRFKGGSQHKTESIPDTLNEKSSLSGHQQALAVPGRVLFEENKGPTVVVVAMKDQRGDPRKRLVGPSPIGHQRP
ncbi:MAG: hypothetical protein ACK49R_05905, partial [Planctomycetota bacterium]